MDAQAQVCLLQNAIMTTVLDSMKTTILGFAIFWNDFSAVINLYADFIRQMNATNTIKIASLGLHGGGGGRGSGGLGK